MRIPKKARLLRRNQREITALGLPPWEPEDESFQPVISPGESPARAPIEVLSTPG